MSVIQNGVMLFQAGHPFLDYVINMKLLIKINYQIPNSLTMAFKSFCSYSGDVLLLSQNFQLCMRSRFHHAKLFFGTVENAMAMIRLRIFRCITELEC